MAQDESSTTSVTLLGRLHHDPSDQAAWSDFVARYGRKILGWCRRCRRQEANAQDVTQEVLLKLNRLMATFVYDPAGNFQAWRSHEHREGELNPRPARRDSWRPRFRWSAR